MIAFISSAYRGPSVFAEQDNARIAQAMSLYAMKQGYAPFASHLLYTQFLDDQNPQHRQFGISMGHEFMHMASIMYVYQPHTEISTGVRGDVLLATEHCVHIEYLTAEDLAECLTEIKPSRLFARIFGDQ